MCLSFSVTDQYLSPTSWFHVFLLGSIHLDQSCDHYYLRWNLEMLQNCSPNDDTLSTLSLSVLVCAGKASLFNIYLDRIKPCNSLLGLVTACLLNTHITTVLFLRSLTTRSGGMKKVFCISAHPNISFVPYSKDILVWYRHPTVARVTLSLLTATGSSNLPPTAYQHCLKFLVANHPCKLELFPSYLHWLVLGSWPIVYFQAANYLDESMLHNPDLHT